MMNNEDIKKIIHAKEKRINELFKRTIKLENAIIKYQWVILVLVIIVFLMAVYK